MSKTNHAKQQHRRRCLGSHRRLMLSLIWLAMFAIMTTGNIGGVAADEMVPEGHAAEEHKEEHHQHNHEQQQAEEEKESEEDHGRREEEEVQQKEEEESPDEDQENEEEEEVEEKHAEKEEVEDPLPEEVEDRDRPPMTVTWSEFREGMRNSKFWILRDLSIFGFTIPLSPLSIFILLLLALNVAMNWGTYAWCEASHVLIRGHSPEIPQKLMQVKKEIGSNLEAFQAYAKEHSACPSHCKYFFIYFCFSRVERAKVLDLGL